MLVIALISVFSYATIGLKEINMSVPRIAITEIDKQVIFLDGKNKEMMPCPSCGNQCSIYSATGTDSDSYNFKSELNPDAACPNCHRPLEYVVPMVGQTFWIIDHKRDAS